MLTLARSVPVLQIWKKNKGQQPICAVIGLDQAVVPLLGPAGTCSGHGVDPGKNRYVRY